MAKFDRYSPEIQVLVLGLVIVLFALFGMVGPPPRDQLVPVDGVVVRLAPSYCKITRPTRNCYSLEMTDDDGQHVVLMLKAGVVGRAPGLLALHAGQRVNVRAYKPWSPVGRLMALQAGGRPVLTYEQAVGPSHFLQQQHAVVALGLLVMAFGLFTGLRSGR